MKIRKLFFSYIKRHRMSILLFFLCSFTFGIVFYLSGLPFGTVSYGAVLCLFVIAAAVFIDFCRFAKKHHTLVKARREVTLTLANLPLPTDLMEEDYWELLHISHEDKVKLLTEADNEKSNMLEYYTMWAHQIKTPIAAMHLLLQTMEGDRKEEISDELFKIEQYVEMVLSYIRLGSDSNDFVIKRCELCPILKQAARKYARLFIRQKLSLSLEEIEGGVLTDEKWLLFVVEQLLSNAMKYTKKGGVKIYMEKKDILVIEDSGIGISPEDLPRVFEKGYTGYNGRSSSKSTGIGLYLCRRIMRKLGHTITIASEEGKGTRVFLDFSSLELETE